MVLLKIVLVKFDCAELSAKMMRLTKSSPVLDSAAVFRAMMRGCKEWPVRGSEASSCSTRGRKNGGRVRLLQHMPINCTTGTW